MLATTTRTLCAASLAACAAAAITVAPAQAECDEDAMHDAWDDCHQFCDGFPISWACKAGCNAAYIIDKATCSEDDTAPGFSVLTGIGGTGVIPMEVRTTIVVEAGIMDASGAFVPAPDILYGELRVCPTTAPVPPGGGFDALPWETVGSADIASSGGFIAEWDTTGFDEQEGYRVRMDFYDATGNRLTTALTTAGHPCPGDADGDGDCDFDDLNVVLGNWGATPAAPGDEGDVTLDFQTDFDDLNQVLAHWQACSAQPR